MFLNILKMLIGSPFFCGRPRYMGDNRPIGVRFCPEGDNDGSGGGNDDPNNDDPPPGDDDDNPGDDDTVAKLAADMETMKQTNADLLKKNEELTGQVNELTPKPKPVDNKPAPSVDEDLTSFLNQYDGKKEVDIKQFGKDFFKFFQDKVIAPRDQKSQAERVDAFRHRFLSQFPKDQHDDVNKRITTSINEIDVAIRSAMKGDDPTAMIELAARMAGVEKPASDDDKGKEKGDKTDKENTQINTDDRPGVFPNDKLSDKELKDKVADNLKSNLKGASW